jgi:hypothetical protein
MIKQKQNNSRTKNKNGGVFHLNLSSICNVCLLLFSADRCGYNRFGRVPANTRQVKRLLNQITFNLVFTSLNLKSGNRYYHSNTGEHILVGRTSPFKFKNNTTMHPKNFFIYFPEKIKNIVDKLDLVANQREKTNYVATNNTYYNSLNQEYFKLLSDNALLLSGARGGYASTTQLPNFRKKIS